MANIVMVAADLTKYIAWGPVMVQRFHGMNNQNATLYIQLHEISPLAAGGILDQAVPPVKSFQVLANLPFSFQMVDTINLSELVVGISTTELTYTAVSAAGGLDMTIMVASDFLCDGTEVVVGDTTTALNVLQVWAAAAGPNTLLSLRVKEVLGTARYVIIEATDADAAVPAGRVIPIAANATIKPHFGSRGEFVRSIVANQVPTDAGVSATPVISEGCTIRVGNAGTFPWGFTAACANIKAVYHPNA